MLAPVHGVNLIPIALRLWVSIPYIIESTLSVLHLIIFLCLNMFYEEKKGLTWLLSNELVHFRVC